MCDLPENALELWALRRLLEDSLDFVVRSSLLDPGGQINDRDIGSRHSEGHSSELAVKSGNNFADSLNVSAVRREVERTLAAPVDEGMMLAAAPRPPRQSSAVFS